VTSESAKLGVSNIAWAGESEEQYFRLLSTLGVQGVEIAASLIWPEPVESTPRQRQHYRKFVSSFGLQISGLASLLFSQPGLQLLTTGSKQQGFIDYLRKTVDLCADLGGNYLVFGRPQNRQRQNLPMTEATDRAVTIFRKVGAHAATRECVVGIEPLPSPGCDFITCLSEAADLVAAVNSPGVRLHFDTGAAESAGEHHLEAEQLDTMIRHASSCQINDHELLPPGSKGHDLHSIWARCLTSIQYSGWITIEMRKAERRLPIDQICDAVLFARTTYHSALSIQAKKG
jgi:sugar phosphate isomerase/epimerase